MIDVAKITMKPPAIRITAWRDGCRVRKAALLTETGLRNVLLNAMDQDEVRVDLIFQSIENTGTYRILDEAENEEFLFEKVLHS